MDTESKGYVGTVMEPAPLVLEMVNTYRPTIGDWVVRSGYVGGRWHHVDSTVADDVLTRCGKRMAEVSSRGNLAVYQPKHNVNPQPVLACKPCKRAVDKEQA